MANYNSTEWEDVTDQFLSQQMQNNDPTDLSRAIEGREATGKPYLNPLKVKQMEGEIGLQEYIAKKQIDAKAPLVPTADMRNSAVNAEQSTFLMSKLEDIGNKLEGGYSGMKAIGKTWVDRGKGEKSSDMKLYLSMIPMASVALYRAVSGDNRLSDADAATRAMPLLWHPSEDKDVRMKKFAFTKDLINARVILLKGGKFTLDKETGDKITSLDEVSNLAKKISIARKAGYTEEEINAYYNTGSK